MFPVVWQIVITIHFHSVMSVYIYMILYVVVSYLIALQSRINYLEIGPSDSLLLFKKNKKNKTLCAWMNLANEKLL